MKTVPDWRSLDLQIVVVDEHQVAARIRELFPEVPVVTATADEALDLVATHHPAVVVGDPASRLMNGRGLFEEMKTRRLESGVRLIALVQMPETDYVEYLQFLARFCDVVPAPAPDLYEDMLGETVARIMAAVFRAKQVFISYSSSDQAFVDRLHVDLADRGVRCWVATRDLKVGDRFRQVIDHAIHDSSRLLLVLSARSITSSWVESEVEAAFERERLEHRDLLFPVTLDDAVFSGEKAWVAEIRRTRHVGDFSQWSNQKAYRRAFERLVRDLQA